MNRINKKAQHEMMGFLVIVVLIVVIGLVFFGFSLRRSKNVDSHMMQTEDLLNAMLLYTSDCEINSDYLSVRELIQKCGNIPTKKCGDDSLVCEKLAETSENLLSATIGQGIGNIENAFIHGYFLEILYSNEQPTITIEKGELNGNYFSSLVPIPLGYEGEAEIKIRAFYSKES